MEQIIIYLFILLIFICGHAISDYALQSREMAINKSKWANTELQKYVPWYFWLSAHSLIQGSFVGLITYFLTTNWMLSGVLILAEAVLHFVIDYGKCKKEYGIHLDQFFHFLCKTVWAGIIFRGIG